MRIALNGCGRIGKNILRMWQEQPEMVDLPFELVNIGTSDPAAIAYFLTYDSVLGTSKKPWHYDATTGLLHGGPKPLVVIAQETIPLHFWQQKHIDTILDASGAYTQREHALEHLEKGGAKRVLVTAPMDDPDATCVYGSNHNEVQDIIVAKNKAAIVSLGSCTTHATVGLLDVLMSFIKPAFVDVMTIHAYTNSQSLVDSYPNGTDMRRSRHASLNIVPSHTGADKAVVQVLPSLKNKLTARAYRVPVCDVSCVEVRALFTDQKNISDIDFDTRIVSFLKEKNHIGMTHDPVVSMDMRGSSFAVVIDRQLCRFDAEQIVLTGWYDNEWGYVARVMNMLVWLEPLI